jgi:hypothetical protein
MKDMTIPDPSSHPEPAPEILWVHKKTNSPYRILRFAVQEDTLQPVVVYEALSDGSVWIRPCSQFFDGRFRQMLKGVEADSWLKQK